MKKETFITMISIYDKDELNNFIKLNGKRKKPTKPIFYPNTTK